MEFNIKDNTRPLLIGLIFLTYLFFIFNGHYQFQIRKQIREFYHILAPGQDKIILSEWRRSYPFISAFYHFPRAMQTYHVVTVSQKTNHRHLNLIFSIQVLINFFLTSLILTQIMKAQKRSNYCIFFFLGTFILISFFMSGRLSFSFLGVALLLKYFEVTASRINAWGSSVLLLLGLWLCCVSSGVFLVTFALCCLMLLKNIFLDKPRQFNFPLIIILAIFSPWVVIGIFKNLRIFNYSLWQMLSHGYGESISSL